MAMTIQDLIARLRAQIKEVTPAEVKSMGEADQSLVLIDVRERDEVEQGHIPGAIHISRGFLELRIENTVPGRQTRIVTYCAGGNRSLLAAESLQRLGYECVASMAGGFTRWRSEGHEFTTPK